MKNLVLCLTVATIATISSVSMAGAELPARNNVVVTPKSYVSEPAGLFTRIKNYGKNVYFDTVDVVDGTIDMVVGTVTLGKVDPQKDDLHKPSLLD